MHWCHPKNQNCHFHRSFQDQQNECSNCNFLPRRVRWGLYCLPQLRQVHKPLNIYRQPRREDSEETDAHLWKAVDAYKLAEEKSTPLSNTVKFLPCLELLMEVLEEQGGPERLAKAEELCREMEESKASVEAIYAAALEEARREGEERRGRVCRH